MINLIKNELIKRLFRPQAAVPFLICFGLIGAYLLEFKLFNAPVTESYTDSVSVEMILADLEQSSFENAPFEIQKYKFILENDVYVPVNSWQMSALNLAFLTYQKQISTPGYSPRRQASDYRSLKLFCDAVLSDNYQSYLKLLSEQVQTDDKLSASDKYYYGLYYSYLLGQNIIPETGDWREAAAADLLDSRLTLSVLESGTDNEQPSYDRLWRQAYNKQAVSEYQIAHNISLVITEEDCSQSSFWQALFGSVRRLFLLQFPIIFLLGGMICKERQAGQLHLLLTCPVNKFQYVCAKIIAAFLLCTAVILASFLVNLVLAGCLFGFSDLQAFSLYVRDGQVNAYAAIFLYLKIYLYASLPLYAVTSLVLFCSSLFRYTGTVWAVSGACVLSGILISRLHLSASYPWLSNTFPGLLDLAAVRAEGSTEIFRQALFSLTVYTTAFLAGTVWISQRKQ